MAIRRKDVEFRGSALSDLRDFPTSARREAGYQLDRIQLGLEPSDYRPMGRIGAGVNEIKVRDDSSEYRVLYVAKIGDAIYVLHCFQKKTQKTSRKDINLATKRYKELLEELKQ